MCIRRDVRQAAAVSWWMIPTSNFYMAGLHSLCHFLFFPHLCVIFVSAAFNCLYLFWIFRVVYSDNTCALLLLVQLSPFLQIFKKIKWSQDVWEMENQLKTLASWVWDLRLNSHYLGWAVRTSSSWQAALLRTPCREKYRGEKQRKHPPPNPITT